MTQVVLAVTFGSFSYGYCASILANIFTHAEFFEYLDLDPEGPNASHANSLIAAFNALLYVGGFVGCCLYPISSSRLGRRFPLGVGSVLVIVGGALQAGTTHNAMMCVARVVTGVGIGHFLPGCPLYQAEVAPAHNRGFLVGLHAAVVGAGFAVAQWMGVAFFNVPGQAGWRVPLALQCVSPLFMLCIVPFLPESPRWLYLAGEIDKAEKTIMRLHRDRTDPSNAYALAEFRTIKAQLDLEAQNRRSLWDGLRDPHLRKRFVFGFLVNTASQSSGSIVILTYSSVIYGRLGFSAFLQGILAGVWTTLLMLFNFLGGILTDKLGRVKQLVLGLLGCLFCLIMEVILTAIYADQDSTSGNAAATFFIFLFVCFFAAGVECPSFVYSSEIFPAGWRALGVGIALSAVQMWSAILNGAAAIAFENIKWKFYLVFICFTALMAAVVFLYFPETKGLTLEEISKAFGDATAEDTSALESLPVSPEQEKAVTNLKEEELIKVRGFQVAPAELEAVLMSHPLIAAAAVIGIPAPNPLDGELPRAFVVRKEGNDVDRPSENQVKKYAAKRLAKYKQLAGGVVFISDLPQTASGKYLKRDLRDLYKKTVTSSKTKV
ncbi:uncharacterized protein PV06_04112 [Exophiala oligosperma]|uniref:Major facilitator superfamily (MFS) profile domain-containing protein n=1 Tax=Exophiala oligosperma TaxID=215243 RepID=A0A0D2ECP5_9EURO|nr:uncharacterized protein PV06_04112 [Exophiala oligosperma]KIW45754.1 hypothetical protein PV06_04112 [Exophiala oligosperma]